MAENSGGGGNAFLGVLVGALLIAVLVVGFFALNGGQSSPDINVEVPEVASPG